MTREEAAKRWEWVIENFNDSSVYLWPDQRQELLASIALLCGPQPDPITGLVPCQYCNGNRETHEVMPSDPDTIWTIMTDRQQLSFINCNWGCEDHVVDINYCPMCGRKLQVTLCADIRSDEHEIC